MKISLNWLKSFVDFSLSIDELVSRLTMAGLEVDSVESPFEHLSDVQIGKIEKVSPHPDADKLRICMVNTGGEENLQIVCGAPNVYEGMTVPVALPGTTLPGGIKLKKSKIRGVESFGMLCSAKELGVSEESSGIMDLSSNFTPGSRFIDETELNDIVVDVDLTPNRADCLSLLGVAREVASFEQKQIQVPEVKEPKGAKNTGKITELAEIEVKDKDLCPKYCARFLSNVKIEPSPWWIQRTLICSGIRPLNNIVDITNYVMLETGQPLHAFDYAKITDKKIIVQRANKGETFVTLDGKERSLDEEMLMICDTAGQIAVAGVMGGENSEISDSTTEVLLESAYFHPNSVRKTARQLALPTDASHRFERGVDPEKVEYALNRAAELMASITGGELAEGYLDTQEESFPEKEITLSIKKCNSRLGISLSKEEICTDLESVGFEVFEKKEDEIKVKVPSYRVDVERPEDLSEEVARIYGYNNIPTTFPKIQKTDSGGTDIFHQRLNLKRILSGMGFNEIINYSFISKELIETCGCGSESDAYVKILNPISEEQSVMRTTLLPGMLETIKSNISKQTHSLKLFEVGNTFFPEQDKDNLPKHQEYILTAWTGQRSKEHWSKDPVDCDFFDMKGTVESLMESMCIDYQFSIFEETESHPFMRPGTGLEVKSDKNESLGIIFEVHHKILKNMDISQPVFMFYGKLSNILKAEKPVEFSKEIPKFPSMSRDITIITPKEQATGEISAHLELSDKKFLERVELLKVYTGEPIPAHEKSLSFRLIYRAKDKTLSDKQINKVHTKITDGLKKKFQLRFPGQE